VTNNPGKDYPAEARRAVRPRTASTFISTKSWGRRPSRPIPPRSRRPAQKQYLTTVARTGGCTTPLLVENELFGVTTSTPWTTSVAQYRANVLAYLQDLAALGAHPVLLVNKSPYTGSSEAVAWWISVSKVADIVREDYLPATTIWRLGPILGNRLLRQSYRHAVTDFTSIGIPANRLGIMLSFLSAKGVGGRNGLQPASAWYQVVKWEALAAKEVAAELRLGFGFLVGLADVEREGDGSREAEGGPASGCGRGPIGSAMLRDSWGRASTAPSLRDRSCSRTGPSVARKASAQSARAQLHRCKG
jgi:hypothetical protein